MRREFYWMQIMGSDLSTRICWLLNNIFFSWTGFTIIIYFYDMKGDFYETTGIS